MIIYLCKFLFRLNTLSTAIHLLHMMVFGAQSGPQNNSPVCFL